MGTMQHKYTMEYFTGRLQDGSPANYGAAGYCNYLESSIRKQDLLILERLNFSEKWVLEFGFGRGESIKYIMEHGAAHYEGVDFSPAAHQLAKAYLQKCELPVPNLHLEDALPFVQSLEGTINQTGKKYDIVIMFDFIEHVERHEMREIMACVKNILHEKGVLVINTPAFRFDNDVASDGVNFANMDNADLIKETSGMHCNKYSLGSLHTFLDEFAFYALSDAHFFAHKPVHKYFILDSFRASWEAAQKRGVPLLEFAEDQIESLQGAPYVVPPVHIFDEGKLLGLSIYVDESYLQYFKNGSWDDEILQTIQSLPVKPNTIFDVGGFMGVSSLLFSRMISQQGRVYCFEPNIENIIRIRKNLSLNPEESQHISVVPMALGKDKGKVCMLMSSSVDNGHSSTSQIKEAYGTTIPHRQLLSLQFFEQNVQVQTLDNFITETGVVPDIIKVDIEGAEYWFLEGAQKALREYRPYLFIELHSPFSAIKCVGFLEKLNYSLYVLHEEDDKRLIIFCSPKECLSSSDLDAFFAKTAQEELILNINRLTRVKEVLKSDLDNIKSALAASEANLAVTKAELQSAQRTLQHPVIQFQRKIWRLLKQTK